MTVVINEIVMAIEINEILQDDNGDHWNVV